MKNGEPLRTTVSSTGRSQHQAVHFAHRQPAEPTQNAFVECLDGKFCNELPNQYYFWSLDEARWEIDQWRARSNQVRPHSALSYLPPMEFSRQAA